MLFPVSPQILHGVKLRSVRWQELKLNSAILLRHKLLDHAAAMGGSAVPNHQQIAVNMAHQMREKLNYLGTSDATGVEPEIKIPPCHSRHCRKRLPVKAILQHRRLTFWRPGPTTVRTLTEPALVHKHYRAALPLGFFLSPGQRFFFQRSMETSSRSSARPVGRWQLQPIFPNSHQTCPGWYFTPHSCLISSATRCRVHSPVSYPKVSGPSLSFRSIFFSSASLSRDLRPARPAFFNPPRPCSAICFFHRPTDWRCTPNCRATSASLSPACNRLCARSRRSSSSSKSLFTPAGFPMQNYLSQTS